MLRRFALVVVGGIALGALVLAAIDAQTDGRILLRVQYRAQSWLAGYSKVTRLRVMGFEDLTMFLNPADQIVTSYLQVYGLWEPFETTWFVRSIERGDVVVDVGANVGYYTLIAAKRVGAGGRVYAFEPDPVGFDVLERNVRLNGLGNVTAEQKAASNTRGALELYLADTNKGDHRIFQTEEERPSISVEAVALDEYFRGRESEVDFVKIDTQGAEALIVEGMAELLGASPDVRVAIEFWPFGLAGLDSDPGQLLDRLSSLDFVFYNLGPGGPLTRLREIERDDLLARYTVENEQFTNLLLVKGRAERDRWRAALAEAEAALVTDSLHLALVRRAWERRLVARAAQGDFGPGPWRELSIAAGALPENRTRRQRAMLRSAFRAMTPLLADERAAVAKARDDLVAFDASLLELTTE